MDVTPQSTQATFGTDVAQGRALSIDRRFNSPGQHPFDTVEWELRDARIGHGDKVAFEQLGVEFPTTWSQNSTNIVSQKYFRGQLDSPARERSAALIPYLAERGVLATGLYRLRFVTHLDVDAAGIDRAIAAIHSFFKA